MKEKNPAPPRSQDSTSFSDALGHDGRILYGLDALCPGLSVKAREDRYVACEEESVKSIVRTAAIALLVAGTAVTATAWQQGDPDRHGIDTAPLEQMRQIIDGLDLPIDSVVVVRHGKIVFEHFPDPSTGGANRMHNLYSVTKSVTSILIGIAIEKGFIEGVDQRVVGFFPNRTIANLDERKERMTLEHLLTMTSGLEWQGPDDMFHSWGAGIRSGDPVQYALDRPMAYEPGDVWYYNGGCSHLLSAILTKVTGMSTLAFARQHLFIPLGIISVRWPRDPHGIYYGGQDIWLTPYDMAKLGQLYLNGGVWDGERIVPLDWIEASTQSIDFPWTGGYGYQWWLYPESGIYYASGAFEQRIYVIPEYDMVVVFTASNWPSGITAGERTEGPPIVDWLLARFVLPSCDAYSPARYADFGFALEIPHLMNAWPQGWHGARLPSEAAGFVSLEFGGSPYEMAGVQWSTPGRPGRLSLALAEFIAALGAFGNEVEATGPIVETTIAGREILQRSIDVTRAGTSLRAIVGAFACPGTGRTFVVYHGVEAKLSEWLDPSAAFEQLVGSFEFGE